MNIEINHSGITTSVRNTSISSDRLILLFFHELLGGEYGVVQCVAPNSEQYQAIKLVDSMFQHSLAGGLLPSVKVWEAAGLRAHHAAFLPVVMPLQKEIVPQEETEKLPLREALREQRAIVHRQYLAGQRACLAAQGAADSVYGWREFTFPNLAVQSYVLAWHYHTKEPVEVIENRCLAMLFELAEQTV